MDVAGVDYLDYGRTEWQAEQATSSGFSRGVNRAAGAYAARWARATPSPINCCR